MFFVPAPGRLWRTGGMGFVDRRAVMPTGHADRLRTPRHCVLQRDFLEKRRNRNTVADRVHNTGAPRAGSRGFDVGERPGFGAKPLRRQHLRWRPGVENRCVHCLTRVISLPTWSGEPSRRRVVPVPARSSPGVGTPPLGRLVCVAENVGSWHTTMRQRHQRRTDIRPWGCRGRMPVHD